MPTAHQQSVAFVAPTELVTVNKWFKDWSEPVRFRQISTAQQQSQIQGQIFPTVEEITFDKWNYPWAEPVRFNQLPVSQQQSQIQGWIYPTVETVTLDKWFEPLAEPVKVRPAVPPGEQQVEAFTPPQIVAATPALIRTASSQVIFQSQLIFQSKAEPVFAERVEVFIDKWGYPWSEPVRVKIDPRLAAALASSGPIGPVLNPDTQISQDFESRWHYPWSEPVRFRRLPVSEYPVTTADTRTPEFVTPDKWTYAWSEPVRFRTFPTSEQQAYAAPAYTPEFITADKWIYPWSEPVRQKIGLKPYLQQAAIGPVLEPETQISQNYESRWHYAWSEPVRIRPQVPAGEQSFLIQGPVKTPEFITVDKWIYGWSEPVRQKIWLKTHLQQAYIAPVLNPDMQISQDFESRWHFPWSEPVRVKRPFLTAQQQWVTYGSAFFETINIDKWGFAWSEPVRQKPGIKTYLQQAFIGLTLDPDTQISQNFESRWHFAWSEPVRVKLALRAGLQQTQVQGPVQTPEFITVDKWIYPWTDPVRQKIGIRTSLQQAFIAPVLADDQITRTFESRWHQPWSEPVRFRRLPTAEQPSYAAPVFTPETITVDKWGYPWTEPVRQKVGHKTHLQQAFFAAPREPSQDYESRWHQAWSEPVRFKRFSTAGQQFVASVATVFETVTMDKWTYPWSEPVRQKIGLRAYLQQAFIGLTLEPNSQIIQTYESRWHQSWSEPVRQKVGLRSDLQSAYAAPVVPAVAVPEISFLPLNEPVRIKQRLHEALQKFAAPDPVPFVQFFDATSSTIFFKTYLIYQSHIEPEANPEQIIENIESRWHQPWSEPLYSKPGLGAWLQRPTTPETPVEPFGITRLIQWFAPLNEPVRLKIGFWSFLQREFTTDPYPIPNPFTFWLDATEVNSDSALFGITVYNAVPVVSRVPTTVVSIKEIKAIRTADVSLEEEQAIDQASVSIKET